MPCMSIHVSMYTMLSTLVYGASEFIYATAFVLSSNFCASIIIVMIIMIIILSINTPIEVYKRENMRA